MMEFFAKDGKVLNEKNERIRLKGVNWFGFETNIYTVHGLWSVSMDSLFKFLKDNAFNAVRLPISLELVSKLDTVFSSGIDTSANPSLTNVTAGKVLDVFIQKCKDYDMLVLLDMHVHKASGPIEDLWWNAQYTEKDWIDGWKKLVTRFKSSPHVFACDLKNEPHGSATWAKGKNDTDWAKAVERIAFAIHSINPKLLIFVEGIENPEAPRYGSFWGGNLSDVDRYQPKLKVANKLVYSPHVYGPTVFMQSYFNHPEFPSNMPGIWDEQFGFIKKHRVGTIVVGEWGGRMEPGSLDEKWQNALGEWLKANETDSFYWSLNPNSGDTKGLVQDDWKTPVQNKLDLLARTHPYATKFSFGSSTQTCPVPQPQPAPVPKPQPVPTPKPQPKPPVTNTDDLLTMTVVNSWGDFHQLECQLHNTTASTLLPTMSLESGTVITQFWNVTQQGSMFYLPDWLSGGLKPDQTLTFGFICQGKIPKISVGIPR
jgi:endoglucanase